MRAVFGAVALLCALAVVGLLAARQLGSAGRIAASASGAGSAAATNGPLGARQIEQQVRRDVAAALQQGAAARAAESDTP